MAIQHPIYGKLPVGNKTQSSLTEFKRRIGSSVFGVPRYSLTRPSAKGLVAARCGPSSTTDEKNYGDTDRFLVSGRRIAMNRWSAETFRSMERRQRP